MKNRIIWIGRHEGLLRDVSRGCAYGNRQAISTGATMMSAFIKDKSILVPMPSHIGYSTTMKQLCVEVARLTKSYVLDCLTCEPHESFHIVKLRGEYPHPFDMYVDKDAYKCEHNNREVYIIDNCIGTGTTAQAALKVLPNATVFAITKA